MSLEPMYVIVLSAPYGQGLLLLLPSALHACVVHAAQVNFISLTVVRKSMTTNVFIGKKLCFGNQHRHKKSCSAASQKHVYPVMHQVECSFKFKLCSIFKRHQQHTGLLGNSQAKQLLI